MKKIMFSDRYGLTETVLSGRKTQTRRIIKLDSIEYFLVDNAYYNIYWEAIEKSVIARWAKCKIGEVVAVAQSYKDAGVNFIPEEDEEFGCHNFPAEQTTGWTNKMFVRAELMPHQIRITNVHVKRLRDISDEDCIDEGIYSLICRGERFYGFYDNAKKTFLPHSTPREAYAALIDRISGKGTWESNPYVFVYDFKLVK